MKKTLLIILTLCSFGTYSACNLPPLFIGYVSMQDVIVQRDLPVGSVIASVTDKFTSPVTDQKYICRDDISVSYLMTGDHVKTNFDNVYTTNIPGLGVRIEANGFFMNNFITNPATIYTAKLSLGQFYPWSISMKFELIKIGAITPGTFSSGKVAEIYSKNYSGIYQPYFNLYISGNLIIKQAACDVITNALTINLDDILTTKFRSIGSTYGEKRFTVGLKCDQGARINVSLNGKINTDTNQSGVLASIKNLETDSAQGVGIQILNNSSPVILNSNSFIKTANGNDDSLEFIARYYQTQKVVKSGVLNSTATLTITYQ